MSVLSWLPGALKDLLRHVPALLFEVVDWQEMREVIPQLTQRLLTGKGAPEVRQALATHLPHRLRFGESVTKLDLNDQPRKQELGDVILELYFVQVLAKKPMFLDLRLAQFGAVADQWIWKGGNLWAEFSPQFARGVTELYAGFFDADDGRFDQGLLLTGLVQPSWDAADKASMARLLKSTFSPSESSAPMRFDLETFQKSFQAVFDFMMKKKARLSPDFVLLGIMLVTLYLSLEELGLSHQVDQAYQRARKQLPNSAESPRG